MRQSILPVFSNSYAKVARAHRTLNDLKSQIQSFNEEKPYILRNYFDKQTRQNVLAYTPTKEIPKEWSVMIGEIAHHLRSALDLAVYQMTVINAGHELPNTEFPIFEDKNKFYELQKDNAPTRKSGLFKIRGLRLQEIRIIESIQPFNVRTPGQAPILTILHHLDVVDKHRTLHLCRRLARSTKLIFIRDAKGFKSLGIEIEADLDTEAIIGRLEISEPDEYPYLDAELILQIEFPQSTCTEFKKSEEVTKTLDGLANGVNIILKLLLDSLNS
ncbi:MAG: hypothetical protein ACT4ON_09100 [Bacteroidota bacterium]